MDVKSTILALGGERVVAEVADVKVGTVRIWAHRGSIPPGRRLLLWAHAERLGLDPWEMFPELSTTRRIGKAPASTKRGRQAKRNGNKAQGADHVE